MYERLRYLKILFFAFIIIIFLVVYISGSLIVAENNYDSLNADQSAYVSMSFWLVESRYSLFYRIERNRMPLYPFILTLVYNQDFQHFFENGKIFNIILSILCLIILFFVFKKYLSYFQSLNLTLITAFTVFIFKAGYIQSEILFYTLFFLSYLILLKLLVKTSYANSVLAGILLALAFLTKAFVLPMIVIFLFCYLLNTFSKLINPFDKKKLFRSLICLFLIFLSFCSITGPYLSYSKKQFGSYFYNVNSTFYMWYDNWTQAEKGTLAYEDTWKYPNLPKEQIPGSVKYFKEHSITQIISRVYYGILNTSWYVFSINKNSLNNQSYGYDLYLLLYAFLLIYNLYFSFLINCQKLENFLKKHFFNFLFIFLILITYSMLVFWYSPIAGGNRFILVIFLPLLFSLAWIANKLSVLNMNISVIKTGKIRINFRGIFFVWNYVLFLLICLSAYISSQKIFYINGGV